MKEVGQFFRILEWTGTTMEALVVLSTTGGVWVCTAGLLSQEQKGPRIDVVRLIQPSGGLIGVLLLNRQASRLWREVDRLVELLKGEVSREAAPSVVW